MSRSTLTVGLIPLAGLCLWALAPATDLEAALTPSPQHTSVRVAPVTSSVVVPTGPVRHAVEPLHTELPDLSPDGVWYQDRVLVKPVEPTLTDRIAERHGVPVLRAPGRSGWTSLGVPASMSAQAFVRALSVDPAVEAITQMGVTRGASASSSAADYSAYQWHLPFSGTPDDVPEGIEDFTVAVLDTGVSYSNSWLEIPGASSLEASRIRDAYDFVNGDPYAGDDHQHGTHVASLIASKGVVMGIAPGVGLMPVKVLNEFNVGDELTLVEGLYHAADHGADVINLSLNLPIGYAPSPALEDALDYVYRSGVIMVGASGNAGLNETPWPAASPLVVAVAASRPTRSLNPRGTEYTNRGPSIDLAAPGGDPARDRTSDGYSDGLLAETIALGDPLTNELWFMSGTSQAAAVVSGAVVRLIALGVPTEEVVPTLQNTTSGELSAASYGAGQIDIAAAEAAVDTIAAGAPAFVTILPFLKQINEEQVKPGAVFTLVNQDGEGIAGAVLRGSIMGPGGKSFQCVTDEDGVCKKRGGLVDVDTVGDAIWTFRADRVEQGDEWVSPLRALMVTEAGESLAAALDDDDDFEEGTLAIQWTEGRQEGLGTLSPSWALIDSAMGPATGPFAILLGPDLVDTSDAVSLDLEMDGLTVNFSDVLLDGTRLVSSPLGLPVRLIAIDGTRLVSSPLGLPLLDFYAPTFSLGGTRLVSSPLGLPLRLDYVTTMPSEIEAGADAVSSLIREGRHFSTDGWQAASWISESLREGEYLDIPLDSEQLVE